MNDSIMTGPTPATLAQLETLEIVPGRPLIVVDVDDCIAVYIEHLTRWMAARDLDLRLESYELEGSIFRTGSDEALPFDDCIEIIRAFFREECRHQVLIAGAGEALHSLAADAQIVILTNAPGFAKDDRRRNLAGQDVPWPVVINEGGKGRALAWLSARADAPTAFVDDSVRQIESVARRAPHVLRLHFAGVPSVRRLFPECAAASARVQDWAEAETVLRDGLKLR